MAIRFMATEASKKGLSFSHGQSARRGWARILIMEMGWLGVSEL